MVCLDNFPIRYVLNRCAVRKHTPLVHAAIRGWDGNLTFIHPPVTPYLACIFPEAPPKETIAVVGAPPGVLGSLEALAVLKYLLGAGSTLKGRLLIVSGLDMELRVVEVARDSAWAVRTTPKA